MNCCVGKESILCTVG